jgi:hypothetical protein
MNASQQSEQTEQDNAPSISQTDEAGARATRKTIIQRVRKYRGLMASDNEHEAKIAKKKATALITEHKITEEEIRGETVTDVQEHEIDGDFTPAWRIALLTIIAQSYHARAIRVREVLVKEGRPVDFWHGKVIALNQDINAIVYLFAYYDSAVNEMVKVRGYDKASESEEDSYRRGLVYSLQQRFTTPDKAAPKTTETTKAMAKTPETRKETASFVDNKYTNRHKDADFGSVKDRRVFYDGVDDARRIPLSGIHRNTPQTKIDSAQSPTDTQEKTT